MPEPHHPMSHHQNDPEKLAKLPKVNTYHASCSRITSRSCRRRRTATARCSITSLCSTAAGMSDSNVHDTAQPADLLVGGGAGVCKGGRHLRYPDETPLTNLYLTLLDKLGVPVERVGDSNGQLEHLSDL